MHAAQDYGTQRLLVKTLFYFRYLFLLSKSENIAVSGVLMLSSILRANLRGSYPLANYNCYLFIAFTFPRAK